MTDFFKKLVTLGFVWAPPFVIQLLFGTPTGNVKGAVVFYLMLAGLVSVGVIHPQMGDKKDDE